MYVLRACQTAKPVRTRVFARTCLHFWPVYLHEPAFSVACARIYPGARPSRRGMMRDATRWLTACPSRRGAVASLRSTASVRQPARPDLGNAPASSMRGAIPHTRAWACRASSLQRSRPLCRLCGTLRPHTRTRRAPPLQAPPPRALRPGSVWAASAVGSDSLPDPTAGGTVPAAAAWRGPAGPRAPPPPPADALAPPLAGAPHVRPRRPPMLAAARARRAGAGSRRVVWSPARCPRHRRVAVSVGGRARRHSAPGGGQAALPLGALV